MRVDADAGKGEFGHIGAADQHRAGGTQASDRRCVVRGRRRVVERLRPGEALLPGDVEQILDRDRQPGEGRGDIPRFAEPVLRIGRGAGAVGVNLDEGAGAFAVGIGDAGQRGLNQVAAGGLPGGQRGGEVENRRSGRGGSGGHDILGNDGAGEPPLLADDRSDGRDSASTALGRRRAAGFRRDQASSLRRTR